MPDLVGSGENVAKAWLTFDGDPSFKNMLTSGSGVLAEESHAFLSSYDHAMFSSYVQWLYQALGGIRVAEDVTGADHVEWHREGVKVHVGAQVPTRTKADLYQGEGGHHGRCIRYAPELHMDDTGREGRPDGRGSGTERSTRFRPGLASSPAPIWGARAGPDGLTARGRASGL